MTHTTSESYREKLLEALFRLERSRQELHPTLATLSGPVGLAGRLWRDWATSQRRVTVKILNPEFEAVIRTWLRKVIETINLETWVIDHLRGVMNLSHSEVKFIQSSPRADRDRFFRRVADAVSSDECRLIRWCLEHASGQSWEDQWDQLQDVLPLIPKSSTPSLEPFQQLIPPAVLPTVQIYVGDSDSMKTVQSKLELGARLVTEFPWLAVSVVVPPDQLIRYRNNIPDSFLKGVVLDSVLPVVGLTEEAVLAGQSENAESIKSLNRLVTDGLTEEDLQEVIQTQSVIENDQPRADQPEFEQEVQSDAARSAAERLLYFMLENTPETAGLFQLNLKPGFRFGARKAELDLACLEPRIAIEVDGYYHFTSPDCYRRDRRKDVLLQEHGFLVLRFLAEDIFPRMEEIRAMVVSVVQTQQFTQPTPHQGLPDV